jgi:hypothetical protein
MLPHLQLLHRQVPVNVTAKVFSAPLDRYSRVLEVLLIQGASQEGGVSLDSVGSEDLLANHLLFLSVLLVTSKTKSK